MSDVAVVLGSLGGLILAIKGLLEAARWFATMRTARREAEANADVTEGAVVEKFQAIWGEEFARLRQQLDELRADFTTARTAWEDERTDMKREIKHLEQTVEALRTQIRGMGEVPAA
jgi:hypothetical protein